RTPVRGIAHHPHHRLLPTRLPCDVDISGAGLFQRQTDKLAAPLDPRPVIKLVSHIRPSSLTTRDRRPRESGAQWPVARALPPWVPASAGTTRKSSRPLLSPRGGSSDRPDGADR